MSSGLSGLTLFVIAAAGAVAQQGNPSTPDAIFYNGKIVTVDAASKIQQAFAVKGEEFLAAGTTAKIRALAGKNTRLVDLRGSTVIPGLADDHHHVYASARVTWRGVDMVGVTTLREMATRLRQAGAEAKPSETVFTTVGWRIPDGRPNRQDLDQISMNVPPPAQLRCCPFPSVLFGMMFGRFLGVVDRSEPMSCSDFGMVRSLLVASGFVMFRRLSMVFCCELVMFGRLLVVFSTLMICHVLFSF